MPPKISPEPQKEAIDTPFSKVIEALKNIDILEEKVAKGDLLKKQQSTQDLLKNNLAKIREIAESITAPIVPPKIRVMESKTDKNFPILTGDENYQHWLNRIESHLKIRELWIDAKKAKPKDDVEKAAIADKAMLAYHHIIEKVDAYHGRMLKDQAYEDSAKCFKILKERYNGTGLTAIVKTITSSFAKAQVGSFHQTIDQIRAFHNDLRSKQIDDIYEAFKVGNLMASLPTEFGSVLASFSTAKQTPSMFEDIVRAVC